MDRLNAPCEFSPRSVVNQQEEVAAEEWMSAWIRMISDEEADEGLRSVLNLARTPHGTVDNVMRVHSLRPSTMEGHCVLYRAVLHDAGNEIPPWLQETLACYVSILNDCKYSLANHWANACHLIGDKVRATEIRSALEDRCLDRAFTGEQLAMLRYAEKLTLRPQDIEEGDILELKEAGLDDGRILEANQIVGYFNYANRLLNGLGVTTEGDVVGYYPNEDDEGPNEESIGD